MLRSLFVSMTRNPLSLLGAAITTASGVLTTTLFMLEVFGLRGSPYIGIIAYLILPMLFVFGLILIPVGVSRERRRNRRAEERGEPAPRFPVIDLNSNWTRNKLLFFIGFTGINIVILSTATFKGVETMETASFCGETCHTVMQPEYTTYKRSPHSRVACVECHIGPGAGWFVKSKLSGAWQVVSVALDLYPRPIPTPVENLRPARETCEHCHWPTKFVGDLLQVKTRYAENEASTEQKTVLLLKVGGIQGRESQGIHWHVDPNIMIRYRADPKRETIWDVELTREDGTVELFRTGEEAEGETEWRVMDCLDCHNRPSHIYRMPDEEVDEAMLERRIPLLPYIRREAVRVLVTEYASHEEARAGITTELQAFYTKNHPEISASRGEEILLAARSLGDIYATNIFPEMKVTWGTYPNHIGHTRFDGCFRCHDDLHETAEGETISQDCETCHTLLAMEEEDPEILKELQP